MKPGDLVYMYRDFTPSTKYEFIIVRRPLVGYVYTVLEKGFHASTIRLEEFPEKMKGRPLGSFETFTEGYANWPSICFRVVRTPSIAAFKMMALENNHPLDLVEEVARELDEDAKRGPNGRQRSS